MPRGSNGEPARSRRRAAPHLVEVVHLLALTAFAIAQPLFDVLGRTPEFLLVRRLDRVDVLLLVGLVSLGPALLLTMIEVVAAGLGGTVRRGLHLAFVATLGTLFVLPLLNRDLGLATGWTLGLAGVAGLALGVSYARFSGVRALVTWLGPAAVVFPAMFVLRPPTSTMLAPLTMPLGTGHAESDVPVVMIVFDEFPAFTLVDATGTIDATVFPNFARLARDGTWFRNATTVATMTPPAIAAILTGNRTRPERITDPANWARNLFTLLGATHDMNVGESYIPFCPPAVCGDQGRPPRGARIRTLAYDSGVVLLHVLVPDAWANDLPDLTYASLLLRAPPEDEGSGLGSEMAYSVASHNQQHWGTTPHERAAILDQFIASIRPTDRPTLNYLHVLLPHVPYVYEPSGKVCRGWDELPPTSWWYRGRNGPVLQQRLLLQVGWLDGMIGRLIEHLERTGLYDRTLVVLVADHGISFRGIFRRRSLGKLNACDILSVPLFVKTPHQRNGGVSDRNVEAVDVFPTIADVLGVPIPWPVEGQSAFGSDPERETKSVAGPSWATESGLPWTNHRLEFPREFGTRCLETDRPLRFVAWGAGVQRLYRVGPQGNLVGHEVRADEIVAATSFHVTLNDETLIDPVPPEATEVPCLVEGRITNAAGPVEGLDLAVAINGTIEAVGKSISTRRRRGHTRRSNDEGTFSIPVPARAFGDSKNVVEIFVPTTEHESLRLVSTQ